MNNKKIYFVSLASLVLNSIVIILVISLIKLGFVVTVPLAVARPASLKPLSSGGLIVVSVAVNNISDSLSRVTRQENFNLPPIRLYDIDRSYQTANSWIAVGDDSILVFLFSDVASILTEDEIEAYSYHEVCHVKLGHTQDAVFSGRDTKKEISADNCAVAMGVKADVLISAIKKLRSESYDRDQRIINLNNFN